jgi:predicted GNAT superfamily acetyltransferase
VKGAAGKKRLVETIGANLMGDAATRVEKEIVVRAATDSSEFGVCVGLQRAIWGYAEIDTVPDQMFVVAKKTGGQVLLAFDGDTAVGFALAFVALKNSGAYLHSHMVGVLAEYRDRGVGRLLKLAQREDALAREIELIEWTFDPLQLKNARFNIARLGAIVRHYLPNLYGRTTSPLQDCRPTDWWRSGGFGRAAWKMRLRIPRRRWSSAKRARGSRSRRTSAGCARPSLK